MPPLGQLMLAGMLAAAGLSSLPAAASGPGVSTGDGSWVWQNPLPQGNAVYGVSCPTLSTCYAPAGKTVLVTTDEGASWGASLPAIPASPPIAALSCPGPATCYGIAGLRGTATAGDVIRTTDGGLSWSVHAVAINFSPHDSTISCPTTTTCYAVGVREQPYPPVRAIIRTTDSGQTWTTTLLPNVATLPGLSCPAAATCYAVGGAYNDPSRPTTLGRVILGTVNGGASWGVQLSTTDLPLYGVSCPAANICFATGAFGAGTVGTKDGGATWPTQSSTATGSSISCPTTSVCYIVNVAGPAGIYATMDSGATWAPQGSPTQLQAQSFLFGVSCPASNTCYAVGDWGVIVRTTSSGAIWTDLSAGPTATLSAVDCSTVTVCFAVGPGVTMNTTSGGNTWNVLPQGPGGDALSCPATSTCYVLTRSQASVTTINKTADGGTTWTTQASFQPTGGYPISIGCPSVNVCYTAGAYGQILATTDGGNTWVTENSGSTSPTATLGDVTCPSNTTCYVVGRQVLRTTDGGASWQPTSSPPENGFIVKCPRVTTCYAIGGAIWISYDSAASWTAFTTTPPQPGSSYKLLSCPNPSTCYAQRGDGLLTLTTDSGATWTTENVGADLDFTGLACPSYNHCWGVGVGGMILALVRTPALRADAGRPWSGGSDAVGTSAGSTDTYFAEGYTGPNFEEYLTVANPGGAQPLTVQYLLADGTVLTRSYALAPSSRTTIVVNDEVGGGLEVSMHLHAANPVVAERPIYFNYPGGITGGHDAVGAASLAQTFYFAEGYTGTGFNEYLTLMDPGPVAARVTVTYLFNGTAPRSVVHSVPARSRATIWVNSAAEAGPGQEVSVQVNADEPILAERPMYFNYLGETGGSDVVGATTLLTDMNLAEGHVGQGFDEYLTLLNPNPQPATATITYYLGSGQPFVSPPMTLAPTSRTTIHVNDVLPAGTDSSVHVHATLPILAERPMYFTYLGRTGGHDAVAVPDSAISTSQMFAEGFVSPNFAEYYTIMNRNNQPANVTITYYDENGTAHPKAILIPPQSRWTEPVNNDLPPYTQNSATITSDVPVLAERPIYFSY